VSQNAGTNDFRYKVIPFSEIYKIGSSIKIWLLNVRSISCLTCFSMYTKDRIIELIKDNLPDIVVLIETNHISEVNFLGSLYDNFYTEPCHNMGIIILTKKVYDFKPVNKCESRGLVIQSMALNGFRVIACYCPYQHLINATIDYLKEFSIGKWFACGDFEQFGKIIIKRVGQGNWIRPEYTRKSAQKISSTECFGSFCSNIQYEIAQQISDHYLIKINMNSIWEGVRIQFPKKLNRALAIKQILDKNSKLYKQMLKLWPNLSFKEISKKFVPTHAIAIKLWKNSNNINEINSEYIKIYKKNKYKEILKNIENCVSENNNKGIATIMASVLKINRRKLTCPPIIGIQKNNNVFYGKEASIMIYDFYRKLFNNEKTNVLNKYVKDEPPLIEFNKNYWDSAVKKLSLHKALSLDECPDELIKIETLQNKLKLFYKELIYKGNIPEYWKNARLYLLSKIKNESFPEIENTRPIIIFSFLYKLLELYWAEHCYNIVWKNIKKHQVGFRKSSSTHVNIAQLKKWIDNNEKGYIVFVDISKAYDQVIRNKLYDILSSIGIPFNYVILYKIMTTNLRVYVDNSIIIPYNNGIPQGSCISPMLFNLYYEKAIETISPYTDLLLVFADDLAILKKEAKNMSKIINNLNNWGKDYNLYVNEKKTEIMLFNVDKPIYVTYPVCTTFKYLGVEIQNNKNMLTRKSIFKKINETAKKLKWNNITNINIKAQKLSIIWWIMSILHYHFITDVFLEYITIDEFKHKIIVSIKTIMGIKKGVKQKYITGLFGLKIKRTIKRMLKHLFNKPYEEKENEKEKEIELNVWNKIIGSINVNVNSLYYTMENIWWINSKKICMCKLCKAKLSFQHIKHYHKEFFGKNLSVINWLIEIKKDYNFAQAAIKLDSDVTQIIIKIKEIIKIAIDMKKKAVFELGEEFVEN